MGNSYPRLSRADVRDFVDSVVRFGATKDTVEAFFVHIEFPPISIAERPIVDLVETIVLEAKELNGLDAEPIEAKFSGQVHSLLDTWPDEAIGDEQFWSYLGTRFFWEFTKIRQSSAWAAVTGAPSNPTNPDSEKQKLERYLVGRDHYQIPLRMYLRGQSVRNGDDYSLTTVDGTDFWRSQVLGVRTSVYPPLARSVVSRQKTIGLDIEDQRPAGRLVNRLRANLEFAVLDEAEADSLVEPLWKASSDGIAKKTSPRGRKSKTG